MGCGHQRQAQRGEAKRYAGEAQEASERREWESHQETEDRVRTLSLPCIYFWGLIVHFIRYSAGASEGSEAESDDEDVNNPYPLEGRYKNEVDRQRCVIRRQTDFAISRVWNGRLNDMPEMQREEILAQRQEEMQKHLDAQNLTKLLAAQGVGEDSVANAAKRAFVDA